jgi:hypothetical protein
VKGQFVEGETRAVARGLARPVIDRGQFRFAGPSTRCDNGDSPELDAEAWS